MQSTVEKITVSTIEYWYKLYNNSDARIDKISFFQKFRLKA